MRPQKPICRYGLTCRKFIQGTCTFYHPEIVEKRPNDNYNQTRFYNGPNYQNQSYQNQTRNNQFSNNHFNNDYGNEPKYSNNQNNFTRNNNQRQTSRETNDIWHSICREYHLGNECRYKQNCKRKHEFIVTQSERLKRLFLIRNGLINDQGTKLTILEVQGKVYQVLRVGYQIRIFEFNSQNHKLTQAHNYLLPNTLGKIHYYNQKDLYIYYAISNQMGYSDIYFQNIFTNKKQFIRNSHSDKITGMEHYNQNVMFTTSLDGTLKMWEKKMVNQMQTFALNVQGSNVLMGYFNADNKKIKLLFLDISVVNSIQVIAVGTNDGRLLLFMPSIQQLPFRQLSFDKKQYSNVYKLKYLILQDNIYAVLLTWNEESILSSIIAVNISKQNQLTVIKQIQTSKEQQHRNICCFQIVDECLFIGDADGKVTIANLDNTSKYIGGILHQNPINDILCVVQEIKSTNLRQKIMFVLQKKREQIEGSLGIYIFK